MIRVLLADDDPRLLGAMERLLGREADIQIVGALHSADGAEATALAADPDVAVIDLSMPGANPLVIVRRMVDSGLKVRVVVFSGHADERSVRAAFDAGAWGYVDKLAELSEMVACIRRVASGDMAFPEWFDGA